MEKPILVVMAAGMGSRYGGLKQMDPMGDQGELILDFSLYDAWKAGFEKVVFIIKKEMEEAFREKISCGAGKKLDIAYAYQELEDIPKGFSVPLGRTKPWGTGHAVLAGREEVHSPFAVINADDFYGGEAFQSIYDFLEKAGDGESYNYCMVGYQVENTLTENGSVARGICTADDEGCLKDITEHTKVQRVKGLIGYEEQGVLTVIPEGTPVSMNLWGFTPSIMEELSARFSVFLENTLNENPLKGEYFLPFVVDELIREKKATVKILHSFDKWHGVTYQEDKETVMKALSHLKATGKYPKKLWG